MYINIYRSDLFLAKHSFFSVGNDTGPMHIIARANKKTLVFFTKFSDPKLCKPTGKDVEIIKIPLMIILIFF